jgi:hypothetical protein
MHPDDIEMTTFGTHQGLFEFLVMPFRMMNAPTKFQAVMNEVLRPFLRQFMLVFFDDIFIFSLSWSEHLCHVRLVLDKLQEHQLFLKRSKCFFGARSVAYLKHIISADSVTMDSNKVQAIMSWPVPSIVRAVWAFLGLAGYYRRFIRDFGANTALLTRLLHKAVFKWCSEAEEAFHALQRTLTTTPVLQLLTFDRKFIVECDASGSGFGAVLHQGKGVVTFSCLIAPHHTKLTAFERELIGLVQAVRHWWSYLWGRPFLVCTDHFSLKFLLDQRLSTIP